MDRQQILKDAINRAARIYYYTGKQIFSDAQFDVMIQELKGLDPTCEEVTRVGAPVPADTMYQKVPNRIPTNSLEKVDTEDELRQWYAKNSGGGPLMVQLKADGSSIIAYYVDGLLDKVVTRGGDEGIGQDVTRNGLKFKGIPHVLTNPNGTIVPFTGGVRGEALLMYDDYRKIDPAMSGQIRNIGTGIIGRGDGTDSKLITFLAFNYEDMGSNTDEFKFMSEDMKITTLEKFGFEVMISRVYWKIDDAVAYWHDVDSFRKAKKLSHQIDGIVFKINDAATAKALGISSGKPNSERVLKFEAPGAKTRIIGITKTVGHTGAQKPTAILEPVVIDKTIVKSAQLNNWEIIAALDIAIGDTVYVQKAKDIIPEIVKVVERPVDRQLIPEPTECYVCGGKTGRLELVNGGTSAQTYCLNDDCSAKSIKRIENWITKNNILGIGPGVLTAMVERFEIDSPAGLYSLSDIDMAGLEVGNGILGIKNATKIYNNIRATQKMTLNNFVGSLGIRHLGRRRVQITREKVPGELDTLADWRSGKIKDLDCGLTNIYEPIMEDFEKLGPVIDRLLESIEIIPDTVKEPHNNQTGVLAGKVYVFTGKINRTNSATGKTYIRKEMEAKVLQNGGAVDDKIKKSSPGSQYVLVQAHEDSTSSKTQDAKAKGAIILSENAFWEMIGDPVPVEV